MLLIERFKGKLFIHPNHALLNNAGPLLNSHFSHSYVSVLCENSVTKYLIQVEGKQVFGPT